MPKQSRAEVAGAHQKSFVYVVPAEKCFNRLDEFSDRVTGLWLANDACILEVFSDLDGDATQIPADHAAVHLSDPFGRKVHQIMVILGQPSQARLRNGWRRRTVSGYIIR